jgi:hypothetical protein
MAAILFHICALVLGCQSHENSSSQVTNSEANNPSKSLKTRDKDQIIDKHYVLLVTDKTSPVSIIDAPNVPDNFDFEKGINVIVENLSDAEIVKLQLAAAVPSLCIAYYDAGDAVFSDEEHINEVTRLRPFESIDIRIPSDISKNYLTPSAYQKNCPYDQRKPRIYVWRVTFAEGTIWKRTPDKSAKLSENANAL